MNVPYVDSLPKAVERCRESTLSPRDFLKRQYIQARGAAVFGHWNPTGCHMFAYDIKDELVDWLNPKPPAYIERPLP